MRCHQRLHLPKSFRIAISACERNSKSPHADKDAEQLSEVMRKSLRSLDPKTLLTFMHLMLSSNHCEGMIKAQDRVAKFDVPLEVIASAGAVTTDEKQEIQGYYQKVVAVVNRVLTGMTNVGHVGLQCNNCVYGLT